MIEELRLSGLGVIDEAVLPLGPGLTVLTGETGAGKTMVVTALGLLLGARADSGVLRAGADQASVEARWLIPQAGPVAARIDEVGGALDAAGHGAASLVLSRSVSADGRSRASAGGRSVPAGLLAELGEHLVVLHGQSEQLRLKSPAAQRHLLDAYAGPDHQAALAAYRDAYQQWRAEAEELQRLQAELAERAREAEALRLDIDELERINPRVGEDIEIAAQIETLSRREDLRLAASAAHSALSDESMDGRDATGLLDAARRQLERVAGVDPALEPILEQLAALSYQAAELAASLGGYVAGLDSDAAVELEELQQRRAELTQLERRYGSLEAALKHMSTGSARLFELDGDTSRIDALTASVTARYDDLRSRARALLTTRREAADRLAEAVTAELAALAMPNARLHVVVTEETEIGPDGADQIALLLQPHPGSEPRPLGKGASGGELSRLMLALEVVIAETEPVPTFIFDEVDAGVGGAAAIEVGRRLARLARTAQVIVVTHLAQVAAFADNHVTVVKDGSGAVSTSSLRSLQGEERVAEMARLLSGLAESDSAQEHARELLYRAGASGVPGGPAPSWEQHSA